MHESPVDYTELLEAINSVLINHPEYLSAFGAKARCVDASTELLFKLDEMKGYPINGYVDGNDIPHNWAVVENWCVDLTARQFDVNAPCPKIWVNIRNVGATLVVDQIG
jgi:hypothetical protein